MENFLEKVDITLEVNPNQLNEILTEYFKNKGYEVTDYRTEFKQECTGHGMNESYINVFKGIKLKVKTIKSEVK